MKQFSYAEVEAATGGFAAKNLVGKGSHGSVYRARLKQQGGGGGGRRIGMAAAVVVAVKRPSHAHGEAKLANEIAVLSAAPRHPGLIGIVGASSPQPPEPSSASGPALPSLLVMEFMPNGSLHDLLHRSSPTRSPPPPPWPRRLEIALDVARAVQALHAAAIIHRDVKSANVLLGPDGRARLADFSLAVTFTTTVKSSSSSDGEEEEEGSASESVGPAPAGTMGYLDPSYTSPERLGPGSDVFSFGVVLLELVSGRKVMDVSACPSSIVSWAGPLVGSGRGREVLDGRVAAPRPGSRADAAVGRVLAVAARCVAESVERRPGMDEVVNELSAAVVESGGGGGGGGGGVVERVCRRVAAWGQRVRRRSKRVVVMRAAKVECTEQSVSDSGGGGVAVAPDPTASSSSCAAAAAAVLLPSSHGNDAARVEEPSKKARENARNRFESELDLVLMNS